MKKKSSSKKNKKNPLKLVKHPEVQVLNLIEKLEKSTERRLSSFVQELVKLKKNQVKLQEKLSKAKKAKAKEKPSQGKATAKFSDNSKISTKKTKKVIKKKKPNPFSLVDNYPKNKS